MRVRLADAGAGERARGCALRAWYMVRACGGRHTHRERERGDAYRVIVLSKSKMTSLMPVFLAQAIAAGGWGKKVG